jgi:hypothetical protein
MRKFLLVFLAILVACSEKTPSETKAKHVKASTTKNTTESPANISTTTNIPLTRDKVSVEAKDAFLNLYGGETWADKIIGDYFKDKTEGYISPKFEGRFTEGGINKLLVLGYITPEPADGYFCHACVPLIGGAIFQKQDLKWVVESVQKIIGRGDVVETGDFNLVQIGPDKYGISIHITDAHQGYEDNRFEILVPYQGSLKIALDAGYIEKPGPAACIDGHAALHNQDVSLKFEPGKNPEYFDAVVRVRYNDGECKHWTRKEETKHYQLHDGKFEPI